jgi:hypothetical protein
MEECRTSRAACVPGPGGVDLLASIETARAARVHRAPADADPGMRSADLQHAADLLPHLIP